MRMPSLFRLCRIAGLLGVIPLAMRGAELPAANMSELNAALGRVQPGDTVVLADGSWRDAVIEIARGGRPEALVHVRARTPGKVQLTGASALTFAAPYVEVNGVVFKDGAPAKGDVVRFAADHCRLSDSAVINFSASKAKYYYVYFKGSHNRVERCFFTGKSNPEPVIGNDHRASRHNGVTECYFKDIPWVNENGREIFRIWGYGGNEELGPDGAFFTIEGNLFERAHGEGMEIISLKSNRNVVRNNTLRASRGGITNRSGNYNTIEGNFIFGDGQDGTYGIRVTGQYHHILHNTITGVSGFGIRLMSGELFEKPLTDKFAPILREGTVHGRVPRYNQPRHTIIAYNTLVDNGEPDLAIGSDYKSGWPAAQRVLLPENCSIVNNLVRRKDGGVAVSVTVPDRTAPLDGLAFAPNLFDQNLVAGGKVQAATDTGATRGIRVVDDLKFAAAEGGAPRPVDTTLAQESAMAAPSVFSKEPSPFRPVTAADVGPAWMQK